MEHHLLAPYLLTASFLVVQHWGSTAAAEGIMQGVPHAR